MSDCGLDRWGSREHLRELVSRPYLVDVLDVLTAGPMTIAQMQSALPGARRAVVQVLRDLVVTGLIVGGTPGSRDGMGSYDERYQCTARGRSVVALLSRFSIWTALYDE
ncbi:hypothetical protein [Mycolicibacterium helvum]|uniref:Transcriptional regulator n=1 Tax=Mycolicibacterium helvum TaxID=1534349 RepID=A0A7I7T9W4_9MYCO|nr:hypothetical protein [Mycolicibacterium helvum]BBY65115.1 hypothetical protein MHEL_33580 [Mycolicibacterium helvum]